MSTISFLSAPTISSPQYLSSAVWRMESLAEAHKSPHFSSPNTPCYFLPCFLQTHCSLFLGWLSLSPPPLSGEHFSSFKTVIRNYLLSESLTYQGQVKAFFFSALLLEHNVIVHIKLELPHCIIIVLFV